MLEVKICRKTMLENWISFLEKIFIFYDASFISRFLRDPIIYFMEDLIRNLMIY